jgi:hypothetical protein
MRPVEICDKWVSVGYFWRRDKAVQSNAGSRDSEWQGQVASRSRDVMGHQVCSGGMYESKATHSLKPSNHTLAVKSNQSDLN